jgi:hypothetical protein
VGEVGECDREKERARGCGIGRGEGSGAGDGATPRDEERVINGDASRAARVMEGGARSGKSAVIKVAKAEGDGAAIRDSRGTESVGEGAAERMEKDSRTHAHHIIQQTYEVRVAMINAPKPRRGPVSAEWH